LANSHLISNNLDQTNWQFFGSDEIKVTPRLTVTLGMRWQPDLHFTEASGKESSFRPGLQSAVFPNAPLGLLFKGDSQLPSNVLNPNWHNLAPRISFAYDLFGTGKTAVRGGYGIFYDDFASIRLNRFPLIQPYVLDTTVFDVPLSDPYQGKSPYPFSPPTTAEQKKAYQFVRPAATTSFNADFRTPLRPAVEFQYPATVAFRNRPHSGVCRFQELAAVRLAQPQPCRLSTGRDCGRHSGPPHLSGLRHHRR
jgi:hypothetical protein